VFFGGFCMVFELLFNFNLLKIYAPNGVDVFLPPPAVAGANVAYLQI
jgi:hypothetical protein